MRLDIVKLWDGRKFSLAHNPANFAAVITMHHYKLDRAFAVAGARELEVQVNFGAELPCSAGDKCTSERQTLDDIATPRVGRLDHASVLIHLRARLDLIRYFRRQDHICAFVRQVRSTHVHAQQLDMNLALLVITFAANLEGVGLQVNATGTTATSTGRKQIP